MARRACSRPLRMASDTSFALPSEMPMLPLRSPTATSAVKEKRRPPFTTLATRFTKMTFSAMSPSLRVRRVLSRASFIPRPSLPAGLRWRSSVDPGLVVPGGFLELKATLPCTFCEGSNSSVVEVSAAIEHDLRDPGCFCALRQQLARRFAQRCLVARIAAAQILEIWRERGDPEQNLARQIVR